MTPVETRKRDSCPDAQETVGEDESQSKDAGWTKKRSKEETRPPTSASSKRGSEQIEGTDGLDRAMPCCSPSEDAISYGRCWRWANDVAPAAQVAEGDVMIPERRSRLSRSAQTSETRTPDKDRQPRRPPWQGIKRDRKEQKGREAPARDSRCRWILLPVSWNICR